MNALAVLNPGKVTVGYAEPSDAAASVSADAAGRDMNEAILAELYRKYAPAIYVHCRRLLRGPVAARDATQEAFVRMLARGKSIAGGQDALRYLYRISTNVCLNQLREEKVRERAAHTLAARAGGLRSAEGGHADRQFAIALLDRCDETGAAIAIMHYVDRMSQVEIAETLGITRRTVFNRLRKLEKLAGELLVAPGVRNGERKK